MGACWRRPRRITVTYYAEWLLGAMRSASRAHVICEYDASLGALVDAALAGAREWKQAPHEPWKGFRLRMNPGKGDPAY